MTTQYVKLVGLDKALRNLRALPAAIAGRRGGPVRSALFAAASVIKKQAIANAPIGKGTPMPGLLKRSIYIWRDRNPAKVGASERYQIMVRGSRKRGAGKLFGPRTALAYYWHFVEFGTSGPGKGQRPQRYLTNAFNMLAVRSVKVFEETLQKRVEAELKKLGR